MTHDPVVQAQDNKAATLQQAVESSDNQKQFGGPISEKLQAAIAVGEIKISLTPRVPAGGNRGVRWSPKGNQVELKERGEWLVGQIQVGTHQPVTVELMLTETGNVGVYMIDTDCNGVFDEKFEKSVIKASETRGKFWYSTQATLELPVDDKTTRPYPLSIWYVVDPEAESPEKILRWSRQGWHEGGFRFNDQDCVALITDADSDGIFTSADAWGLGSSPGQAYEPANSSGKIDRHAWLDSIPFRIVDFDEQGRWITIRAFDLGMTEAEDREKKDPYAADRKFPRGEKPVTFLHDYDEAMALAKKGNRRVVIDFVTTWCGPCAVMDQLVYTAQPVTEKSGDFVFLKLDGDEQKELKEKYEIAAFPTLILVEPDGTVVRKSVGYQGVRQLLEFLK